MYLSVMADEEVQVDEIPIPTMFGCASQDVLRNGRSKVYHSLPHVLSRAASSEPSFSAESPWMDEIKKMGFKCPWWWGQKNGRRIVTDMLQDKLMAARI